jgi:hypothetical protein
MRTLLTTGCISQDEVARSFGMNRRTFARRLQESGTTFRALLDAVRFDAARVLLRGSAVSLEDIANRLGYADVTAFARAFRRWSGGISRCLATQTWGGCLIARRVVRCLLQVLGALCLIATGRPFSVLWCRNEKFRMLSSKSAKTCLPMMVANGPPATPAHQGAQGGSERPTAAALAGSRDALLFVCPPSFLPRRGRAIPGRNRPGRPAFSSATVAKAEPRLGKAVGEWGTCPVARSFAFSTFSCRFVK